MKRSSIVLITNHYPFGQGESFLEYEIPYLAAEFERVLVISKNTTSSQTHHLPQNVIVERISATSTFLQNLKTVRYCIKNREEFTRLLKEELRYTKQRNKRRVSGEAFQFLFKAFQLSVTLKRFVIKHNFSDKICFYSYWANNSALAIILLKNQFPSIQICRAHGGDLYEYRQKNNYLPFREILVKNLTRMYPVSIHGEQYLKSFFKYSFDLAIERSYLGTIQPVTTPIGKSVRFTVVSCSSLISLKRIHLIIESIALLTQHISWIHFGDGPLKAALATLAQEKLSTKQNIEFTFKGFVSNAELIDFYAHNHVDVFINTSQYEGIPVSMMEAQSFGIPIIGTDVGAVGEIVTPQTGKLIPEDATPEVIADNIRFILSQSPEQTLLLRLACKAHWEANFKAANNFSTFAKNLKLLLNETSG